jgi:hypothetical protein
LPEEAHTVFGHEVEGGVAAGGDKGDEGRLEGWIGEVGGGDVAFEVVHRGERQLTSVCESFGCRDTDEESPDQTRTHRDGYTGYIVERHAGVGERLLYDAVEAFEVGAGGDLGDDAAVAGVLRLGVDDVGERAAA